jgi:hypothetical protein
MLPWIDDVVRLSNSTFEQVSRQIPRLHSEIIGLIKNQDLDVDNDEGNENPEPHDEMQVTPPPQDSELANTVAPTEVWLPTDNPVSPLFPGPSRLLNFASASLASN